MIDYHCHLLPGLDDGPRDVEQSLAMAGALVTFGFDEVCCTPHCVRGHYEHSPVAVRSAVATLQTVLDQAGIKLKLHPGMEYYLDGGFEQFLHDLLPLGNSRLILCEAPPQVYPEMVVDLLGQIVQSGYIPLLAHPERSNVVWSLLASEVEGRVDEKFRKSQAESAGSLWLRLTGVRRAAVKQVAIPGSRELPEETLFQANLGSFVGYYGPQPQRRAYQLLKRGVYSCLASDLHEGQAAEGFLQMGHDKMSANPILQRLAAVDLIGACARESDMKGLLLKR